MRSGRRWFFAVLAGATLLAAIVAASLVHMGSFDVAADTPHSQAVFWLMNTVRERSIAIRAAGIAVPSDLTDFKRIASGAGQHAAMCSSCHLAPGMKRTEIARGLYQERRSFAAAAISLRLRSSGGETRPQDDGDAGMGLDA